MGTNFVNPIRRGTAPTFHESSAQRSGRDSDSLHKIWKKDARTTDQLSAMAQAVEQLQRELNRLRSRKGMEGVGSLPQVGSVQSRVGDILIVRSYNGEEGTTDIPVAMNFDCREFVGTETIAGVNYTYSAYYPIDSLNNGRTSTGPEVETQVVTPMYRVGTLIVYYAVSYTGLLYDNGVDTPYDPKFIEDSGRCWAKVT